MPANSPQDPSSHNNGKSSRATSVKPYACVLCSRRKVRCDRLVGGCTNCTKARAECVYVAPAPPRRRKRGEKAPEIDLVLKLKHYEELLTSLGVRLDGVERQGSEQREGTSNSSTATASMDKVSLAEDNRDHTNLNSPGIEYGMVIGDQNNTRYLANQLYADVGQEFSKEILEESSESEDTPFDTPGSITSDPSDLLIRHRQHSINLKALHPSPVVIFQLWQKHLENVNPIIKIIHIPTAQQMVLDAASNLDNASKSTEAFMFAIYFSAVITISNEECECITGEPKSVLRARYQFAVQQALTNAGLLRTSELVTLQAFQIFLLAVNELWDPKSFWALTGVSIRISQRMGLHRDGTILGLSIFQTEMRRRLWWEIVVQDARAGEMAGSGDAVYLWDTKMPLNVEDSALSPNMQEPPIESTGPTEMIFARVRYEIGEWLRKRTPASTYHGAWVNLMSASTSSEEKHQSIDDLEAMFEERYLRHADMSVPIHFLAFAVIRSATAKMRFMTFLRAHRLKQKGEATQDSTTDSSAQGTGLSDDTQFLVAVRIAEYNTLIQRSPVIERFRWHVLRHFQWLPFIYLLGELRLRTSGQDVTKAWKEVGASYDLHPEIIIQTKRALHVAVGSLTLKAWQAFEAANGHNAYRLVGSRNGPPRYILDLRSQRKFSTTTQSQAPQSEQASSPQTAEYPDFFAPAPTTQYPESSWMAQSAAADMSTGFYQSPATNETPSDVFTGMDVGTVNPSEYGVTGGYVDVANLTGQPAGLAAGPLDWGEWEHLVQDFQTEAWDGYDVDADMGI